jgi:predicted MFS family arabinose efflux permease
MVRAGDGDRGTATATFTAIFDLALFCGSPLIGASINWFGYPSTFKGMAVTIMVGLALFLALDRRYHASGLTGHSPEAVTAPIPHV